jgi:hypothetical protein
MTEEQRCTGQNSESAAQKVNSQQTLNCPSKKQRFPIMAKRPILLRLSFLLAVVLGGISSSSLVAQNLDRLQVPVTEDGVPLDNPFTGGLNNPQLSAADLNNDGIEDLYIFDRNGNIHLTFINEGTPNEPSYLFAPEYADNFPSCVNWVILKDYNDDGIEDLFTHFSVPFQGITVYTGSYNAQDELVFEIFPFCCEGFDALFYEQFNGNTTQVFISNVDYPSLNDVDGDGDLDILTFGAGGGYVEYFQNQSVEMGYGADSLLYKREDICWGKFYEASFSEEISLSDDPNTCSTGFTGGGGADQRHPGSTLLTFDEDNDGDLEILLGDVNFPKLNFLRNGGDAEDAYMTEQDPTYPSYDVPIQIPNFPASFMLDINNDGLNDLIASPNSIDGTPNREVVWFYENTGSNELPVFEYQQSDLLVEEMIDLGSGAHPTFVDVNADGLLDIVVGNDGYFNTNFASTRDPRLTLFLNTGTETDPSFDLVDDDWLGLGQFGDETYNLAPTFGDMDGDGDQDLLIGEQDGNIFYAENTAGAGNPMIFGPFDFSWMDIDVGLNSHPFVIDLDRDGKLDLLIGERNGNINFLPNQGTVTEPFFDPEMANAPNDPAVGDITTQLPTDLSAGNSAPFVLDYGDQALLVAGSQAGPVQVYSDVLDNIYGLFTLANPNLGGFQQGKQTSPAFADINNDGFLECLVGNLRGGLVLYSTDLEKDEFSFTYDPSENWQVSLFPNPTREELTINLGTGAFGQYEVQILDGMGRLVQTVSVDGQQENTLNVAGLTSGMYWLVISNEAKTVVEKFVKQ